MPPETSESSPQTSGKETDICRVQHQKHLSTEYTSDSTKLSRLESEEVRIVYDITTLCLGA